MNGDLWVAIALAAATLATIAAGSIALVGAWTLVVQLFDLEPEAAAEEDRLPDVATRLPYATRE